MACTVSTSLSAAAIVAVLFQIAGTPHAQSAGSATTRPRLTLSQYDQVGAEVNGTLDVALLQRWMTETNANTHSFLLWDTDGHQYLDSEKEPLHAQLMALHSLSRMTSTCCDVRTCSGQIFVRVC